MAATVGAKRIGFFAPLDIERKLYENDRQRNEPSFGFFPPEMIGFTLDEKGKIQSEKEGVFRQYLLAEGVISVCIKENAETADYFKVRKVEWES
mgnify:CR=1 FL=1